MLFFLFLLLFTLILIPTHTAAEGRTELEPVHILAHSQEGHEEIEVSLLDRQPPDTEIPLGPYWEWSDLFGYQWGNRSLFLNWLSTQQDVDLEFVWLPQGSSTPVWTNFNKSQVHLQADTNDTCNVDSYKDLPKAERCDCSKQRAHDSFVNWASFYYCVAGEKVWAFPVLLLAIFFTFTLLASTADQYLVPSLEKLATFLNLSPNVAGVTLLAFGNGAPDVFSSFAALTGQSGDSLGISAILGAGVFVTTVVLAACIFPSEFPTHRRPFVRDVVTYVFGVTLLLFVFLSGEMKVWQSLVLFISYFLYVLLVIVGRYYYQKYMKPRANATPLLTVSSENTEITPSPAKDATGMQKMLSEDEGQAHPPQTLIITSELYTPDQPESELQDGKTEGSKGGLDDLALYHTQVSLLKSKGTGGYDGRSFASAMGLPGSASFVSSPEKRAARQRRRSSVSRDLSSPSKTRLDVNELLAGGEQNLVDRGYSPPRAQHRPASSRKSSNAYQNLSPEAKTAAAAAGQGTITTETAAAKAEQLSSSEEGFDLVPEVGDGEEEEEEEEDEMCDFAKCGVAGKVLKLLVMFIEILLWIITSPFVVARIVTVPLFGEDEDHDVVNPLAVCSSVLFAPFFASVALSRPITQIVMIAIIGSVFCRLLLARMPRYCVPESKLANPMLGEVWYGQHDIGLLL